MTTKTEPQMVFCTECGGPWGVLREGNEARRRLLQAAADRWPNVDAEGALYEAHVVYLSAGSARFAQERFGADCVLPDCWQNADHVDAPMWWLCNRRRRKATLLDCCSLSSFLRKDPA